jgi:hypothetical protein
VTVCDAFGVIKELLAECSFYVGGGSGVGSWDETKLRPVSFGGQYVAMSGCDGLELVGVADLRWERWWRIWTAIGC